MHPTCKSTGDLGVTAGVQIATGKGILCGVNIHAAAADVVVTIYDNTSAVGKKIFQYTLDISVEGLAKEVCVPNVRSDVGLYAVVSGTGAIVMVHYK